MIKVSKIVSNAATGFSRVTNGIPVNAEPVLPKKSQAPDIRNIGLADGHCDTITTAMENSQRLRRNKLHLDFERLLEFGAPVQVFTVWCADKYLKNSFLYANSAIDFFEKELEANSDIISKALSFEDVEANARAGKISAILALEGGEPLSGEIENLNHFYERGVRLITLTWNHENLLGYGVSTDSDEGLKPFGIECVKRMNELDMIIDVSHLNEAGFWDVHNISEKPYIASHSNAYTIAAHRRNLKDAQIKAIIEKGGLIGINLYPYFLTGSEYAEASDVLKHIDHFMKLGAAKNVVLGCDFDGVEVLPAEFDSVSSMSMLNQIISEGFGATISYDIMSKNFLSFLFTIFNNYSTHPN